MATSFFGVRMKDEHAIFFYRLKDEHAPHQSDHVFVFGTSHLLGHMPNHSDHEYNHVCARVMFASCITGLSSFYR